jgi:hypothetical protein
MGLTRLRNIGKGKVRLVVFSLVIGAYTVEVVEGDPSLRSK